MASYSESIKEIFHTLQAHLAVYTDDVLVTLKSVENGERYMPETISKREARLFRALCRYIAGAGINNALQTLQSMLKDSSLPNPDLLDKIYFSLDYSEDRHSLDRLTLIRQAVLLISYIFYDEFHYPQPETGMYDISEDPFQKLKWLYRYWFNQLEVAEKGSGLEDIFTEQKPLNYDDLQIEELPEQPVIPTVSVSCAGDLLAVDVLTPENTPHLFDDITDFYSTADIVSANLESTVDKDAFIGRTQESCKPARMNTSEAMFQKFRDNAGINYFSTATNHAMDWGENGVCNTLDILKKSGAYFSGTAMSQAEQDDVVVVEKNGIKVALLAYTFDLNGYEKDIPAGKPYLVNVVRFNDANPAPNYSLIKKQVETAKAKGAEHIIAYCHWGWEFEMYPHVNIREAAYNVIDCGVDTIFGNHAHVSQPAELVPRPGKQDALVIYAFGDFVSYHPESRNSKLAYIIKFNLMKFGNVLRQHIQALPIYIVNAKCDDGSYDCRIVKFDSVLKNPDVYGLTELEKNQLPHLRDKVWKDILSPLSNL